MINTYQALFPYAANKQLCDVVMLDLNLSPELQQGFRLAGIRAFYQLH